MNVIKEDVNFMHIMIPTLVVAGIFLIFFILFAFYDHAEQI